MKNLINETVKVGAVFESGSSVKPVWFIWQGRLHRIREITYRWKSRRGQSVIRHFAVTDQSDLYELKFDTCACVWRLGYVEMEG